MGTDETGSSCNGDFQCWNEVNPIVSTAFERVKRFVLRRQDYPDSCDIGPSRFEINLHSSPETISNPDISTEAPEIYVCDGVRLRKA